jgi:hypothetical protein
MVRGRKVVSTKKNENVINANKEHKKTVGSKEDFLRILKKAVKCHAFDKKLG